MAQNETFSIPTAVSAREVGDQTLVVNLETSGYHELNAVGGYVWRQLGKGMSTEEIVAAVCEEFSVDEETAGRDIATLVTGLLERGLLDRN